MEYIAIATAIIELWAKCREIRNGDDPNDEEVLKAARGVQGFRTIRQNLRDQGLRGRRLRQAMRREWSEVKAMDDNDLLGFIKDAVEDGEDD